jgi:hypothetical protein
MLWANFEARLAFLVMEPSQGRRRFGPRRSRGRASAKSPYSLRWICSYLSVLMNHSHWAFVVRIPASAHADLHAIRLERIGVVAPSILDAAIASGVPGRQRASGFVPPLGSLRWSAAPSACGPAPRRPCARTHPPNRRIPTSLAVGEGQRSHSRLRSARLKRWSNLFVQKPLPP